MFERFLTALLLLLLAGCGANAPANPPAGTPTPHPFLGEERTDGDESGALVAGETFFSERLPTATPPPEPTAVFTAAVDNDSGAETAVNNSIRVPILMYHHIDTIAANAVGSEFFVSPNAFRDQMGYLADAGYTPITLDDLSAALNDDAPLPENPVILTFDDGYLDNYENAFPILQQFGFPATFFIITDLADDGVEGYMTWDMLAEMADAGMRIESHTRAQGDLRQQEEAALRDSIDGARQAIARHTGQTSRYLAYPKGHYDEMVLEVLADLELAGALKASMTWQDEFERPFEWPRLFVPHNMPVDDFANLVSFAILDTQVRQARANERLLAANIYHDNLEAGWQLDGSTNSDWAEQDNSQPYLGDTAIAAKLSQPGDYLLFHVGKASRNQYRREQVFGFGFWLYSGTSEIAPDDLSIIIEGSNIYPYWRQDDNSLAEQTINTFSGRRLYGLDFDRPLPPQTWIRVEILLDELFYDPLYETETEIDADDPDADEDGFIIDPDYEFVTGFYLQAEGKLSQTIYLDEVQILLLE